MWIHEVCNQTGLTKKAVYFYIQKGLLSPEIDSNNNYFIFSDEDVEKLRLISQFRNLGLSIKEIEMMINSPDRVDIILHSRRADLLNNMSEEAKTLDILDNVFLRMPPNCRMNELGNIIRDVTAVKTDHSRTHLLDLFPNQKSRKYALIMWEAFLDMPLNTDEKFNTWKQIIEIIDDAFEDGQLQDYDSIYSKLSDKEIDEDYRLRQMYVQRTAFCVESEHRRKTNEILSLLMNIDKEKRLIKHWVYDYDKLVLPVLALEKEKIGHLLSKISYSYSSYIEEWTRIGEEVFSILKRPENREYIANIEETMREAPLIIDGTLRSELLMYFDLMKNSLYLI